MLTVQAIQGNNGEPSTEMKWITNTTNLNGMTMRMNKNSLTIAVVNERKTKYYSAIVAHKGEYLK